MTKQGDYQASFLENVEQFLKTTMEDLAKELTEQLRDDDPSIAATAAEAVLDLLFDGEEPPEEWHQSALGQLIAQRIGRDQK